jgi:transposase-like protein
VQHHPMEANGKRRRYDEAFKRRAVRMLVESGKPVTAIAVSVGVDHSILYRWNKKYCCEFAAIEPERLSGKVVRSSELVSLKKEIESIKSTVSYLRSIVTKSFSRKYLEES